jgi:hypothetical protein
MQGRLRRTLQIAGMMPIRGRLQYGAINAAVA